MRRKGFGRRPRCVVVAECALVMSVLCLSSPGAAERPGASAAQTLVLGEKIYREGVLPSGEPMVADLPGSAPPTGTTFTCAGCHRRSGLGAVEEGLRTPPINGERLFRPMYRYFPELLPDERTKLPARFQTPPVRDGYTDLTLAAAIRSGIDPNGRRLNAGMPRYRLSDPEMAILVSYLKNLSARPSPGVTGQTLTFATVIADGVPQQERDAMLQVLERTFTAHNNLGSGRSTHMGGMLSMQVMMLGYRDWRLARWLLSGPPDTWREQLEAHERTDPAFALVGGLVPGSWEPIHRFCEEREIPCILPLTDPPALAPNDQYTLYFSKGYYQEGESAAQYLQGATTGAPRDIIQVLGPGPGARALARGFEDTWRAGHRTPIETVVLGEGTPLGGEPLARLARRGKNCDLLLWTGPESYGALASLAAAGPGTVVMSASLLGGRLWELPPEARAFTLVTYPWREPGEKKLIPPMGGRPFVVNKEFRANDRRIASRTQTAVEILSGALVVLERDFYRDRLLDLIDLTADQEKTDYEKLSFSPGKRYASDGCYLMQLSQGPNPTLTPKSEWIQH